MPIIVSHTFLLGFAGWMLLIQVFYDGEPFEYTYDLGSALLSRQDAEAVAKRIGCEENALKRFLTEVSTGEQH